MVKHYNTSISEDAARILNSKQGQFLGDDVQGPVAVINIRPRANIVKSVGTSTTIYTTPTDKDFYLCSAYMSVIKDAAATGSAATLTATVDGVSVSIMACASITLTAHQFSEYLVLDTPIKVDRGTAIAVSASNWSASRSGITGYTVETTK